MAAACARARQRRIDHSLDLAQRMARGNALFKVHVTEQRAVLLIHPRISDPLDLATERNHIRQMTSSGGFFSGLLA